MCVHCVNCSEQAKKEAEQKRKKIQAKLAMSQTPTVSQYLFHCVHVCIHVQVRVMHYVFIYDVHIILTCTTVYLNLVSK